MHINIILLNIHEIQKKKDMDLSVGLDLIFPIFLPVCIVRVTKETLDMGVFSLSYKWPSMYSNIFGRTNNSKFVYKIYT